MAAVLPTPSSRSALQRLKKDELSQLAAHHAAQDPSKARALSGHESWTKVELFTKLAPLLGFGKLDFIMSGGLGAASASESQPTTPSTAAAQSTASTTASSSRSPPTNSPPSSPARSQTTAAEADEVNADDAAAFETWLDPELGRRVLTAEGERAQAVAASIKVRAQLVETRPKSTTANYDKPAKRYIAWANDMYGNETVTGPRLLCYLQHYDSLGMDATGTRKAGSHKSHTMLEGETKGIMDLWRSQGAALDPTARDARRTPRDDVREWLSAAKTRTRELCVQRDDDRADNTLIDSFGQAEYQRLNSHWLSSSKPQSLRARAAHTLTMATITRGDTVRQLQFADLQSMSMDEHKFGPAPCTLLIDVTAQGKMNQVGKKESNAYLRHREVLQCAHGSQAFYLLWRLDLHGEGDKIDWADTSSWMRRYFLVANEPFSAISASTHHSDVSNGFEAVGIHSSKIVHSGRLNGAQWQIKAGAARDAVAAQGRWNETHMDVSYLNVVPPALLLTAAGHGNTLGCFEVMRAYIEPPTELLNLVFPCLAHFDEVVAQERAKGIEPRRDRASLVDRLRYLRIVALQDAAVLQTDYPDNAVFKHPVFSALDWPAYAERVRQDVARRCGQAGAVSQPDLTRITNVLPTVGSGFERLSLQLAANTSSAQSSAEVVHAVMAKQHEQHLVVQGLQSMIVGLPAQLQQSMGIQIQQITSLATLASLHGMPTEQLNMIATSAAHRLSSGSALAPPPFASVSSSPVMSSTAFCLPPFAAASSSPSTSSAAFSLPSSAPSSSSPGPWSFAPPATTPATVNPADLSLPTPRSGSSTASMDPRSIVLGNDALKRGFHYQCVNDNLMRRKLTLGGLTPFVQPSFAPPTFAPPPRVMPPAPASTTSAASTRTSSSTTLPSLEQARLVNLNMTLKTVRDVWDEFTIGYCGGPAIRDLVSAYQVRWLTGRNNMRKYYNSRCILYEYISSGSAAVKILELQTILNTWTEAGQTSSLARLQKHLRDAEFESGKRQRRGTVADRAAKRALQEAENSVALEQASTDAVGLAHSQSKRARTASSSSSEPRQALASLPVASQQLIPVD